MTEWFKGPIAVFAITVVIGSLMVNEGRFAEFAVMALAFILAKQFEKED